MHTRCKKTSTGLGGCAGLSARPAGEAVELSLMLAFYHEGFEQGAASGRNCLASQQAGVAHKRVEN
jgi:hypothetical protein